MIVRQRIYSVLLLFLLAGSLTLVLQKWVGGATIYHPGFADARRVLHESIFHNQLPPGRSSWSELGANGTNIRIATVYLAEAAHRISKFDVLRIYKWVDTVALFASFLLLFVYLRQTSPPIYALVGILYFAAILPLTYFFSYFHPWDRVSLACWIALLMLLRSGRLIAFAVLLAITITVKFDVILLPGLYFLAKINRENAKEVLFRTALLFALSFGIWFGLRGLFPGGREAGDMAAQLLENWSVFRSTLFSYPPLLGFVVPIILAFIGFRWSDRFSRASVIFALSLFIVFLRVNFIEIRAQMPLLALLLPSALIGLRALFDLHPVAAAAHSRQASRVPQATANTNTAY